MPENESGAPNSENGKPGSGAPGNQDNSKTISLEDHQRALADLNKFKTEARSASEKLTQLQTELETLKTEQLKGKEDYKTLYEAAKTSAEDWKGKYEGVFKNLEYNEKFKTAQAELTKAGLRPEALKILEKDSLEDMKVEATNQGRFLVHGAELVVDRFKREYPFAFGQQNPPAFNPGGGNGGNTSSKEVTPAMIVDLERKMKASGKQEDKDAYYGAVKAYQEARKKKQ